MFNHTRSIAAFCAVVALCAFSLGFTSAGDEEINGLRHSYCVPGISALLDRTGEFRHRTQQRYDKASLVFCVKSKDFTFKPKRRKP